MTRVEFFFNVEDKLTKTAELCERAVDKSRELMIFTQNDEMNIAVQGVLWRQSATSFLASIRPSQAMHMHSSILVTDNGDKLEKDDILINLQIEHVKKVLNDVKRVYPDYEAAQGYELAGFVWLQGFNDMVDGHAYPTHNKPNRFDHYSEWLAHFIRDVRKDLAAPNLPFVIGVMGVGGLKDKSVDTVAFRRAMAAPAAMPEFKGNVAAVQTAPFWSDELGAIDKKHEKVRQMRYFLDSKHKDHANADGKMTEEQKREFMKKFEAGLVTPAEAGLWKRGASNAGYHYLGCAKTFALMGKAFAEATLTMMKRQ